MGQLYGALFGKIYLQFCVRFVPYLYQYLSNAYRKLDISTFLYLTEIATNMPKKKRLQI